MKCEYIKDEIIPMVTTDDVALPMRRQDAIIKSVSDTDRQ